MTAGLIDTHTHVFQRDDAFAHDARYRPDHDADIATLRGLWSGHGVSHGVLIQPSFYGTDNRRLLNALNTDPGHLRGVVVVDTQVDATELATWHALGVRGIRLNLLGQGKRLAEFGSTAWMRVYRDIAPLGWHVEVQPEPGSLPQVLATLADCPASIVIDHFGRPDPALGVRCPGFATLKAFAGGHAVFVKLSGAYRNAPADCQPFALRLLDDLGPDRLMWGSDWPWTNFEAHGFRFPALVEALTQWVPDTQARQTIRWDTAARVFGFE
jgi:predicted TIM-barrel fold metal-dependent hydrolase